MDCSTLPSGTVFIHREDVYETDKSSKINTWHFIDSLVEAYKNGQKLNKHQRAFINDNAVSVHNINFPRNQPHQKSEQCTSGCYYLDASSLPQFMLLPDHISKPLIYSTQGNLSPKTSPQAQHLNIFPNKGINIDNFEYISDK